MSKTSTERVRVSLSGPTMGSRWSAVLFAPAGLDPASLAARLAQAVGEVDRRMSTWREDSDLMRLNRAPVGVWVDTPVDLAHVLAAALRIGRATQGAFDIGVGAAVAAWGFGAQACARPGASPLMTPRAIEALEVDETGRRARKRVEVSLDLSAIAKGFGVDAMARALDAHGLDAWLVGVDGEMRARGLKPDGEPFMVALERPEVGRREAMGAIALHDAAIATSGDYRHVRQGARGRYSHTIDPATGAPLDHALASVTVIAKTAMEADAFATGLMALGPARGVETAARLGLDALFALRRGEEVEQRGVGLFAA